MSKVVLITGASRGIGAATAILAAQHGYRVAINYQNNKLAAEAVLDQVRAMGSQGIIVQANVSVESDVKAMFRLVDEGLGSLSALVNNAGVLVPSARVEDYSAERINHLFQTNVTSVFLCCKEAIKRMSTRHGGTGGSIVNMSSAASRTGSAGTYVDYAATKGAIDTLTLGLSQELAEEGIRVNAVRPGFIDTEMHDSTGVPNRAEQVAKTVPMKRNGRADEIAPAVIYLLSNEASYTSGALLDVAGAR